MRTKRQIWIEWIVWNAAALATLALLVGLLLASFDWLDRIDPDSRIEHAERRARIDRDDR